MEVVLFALSVAGDVAGMMGRGGRIAKWYARRQSGLWRIGLLAKWFLRFSYIWMFTSNIFVRNVSQLSTYINKTQRRNNLQICLLTDAVVRYFFSSGKLDIEKTFDSLSNEILSNVLHICSNKFEYSIQHCIQLCLKIVRLILAITDWNPFSKKIKR